MDRERGVGAERSEGLAATTRERSEPGAAAGPEDGGVGREVAVVVAGNRHITGLPERALEAAGHAVVGPVQRPLEARKTTAKSSESGVLREPAPVAHLCLDLL